MKPFVLIAIFVIAISACSPAHSGASPTSLQSPGKTQNEIMLTPIPTTSFPSPSPTVSPTSSVIDQLPNPQGYTWQVVQTGLSKPVNIANAGDGSGRLFIVEKAGKILVFTNGALLPDPFLDITIRVGSRGSEQGLLGLAFHPKFKDNGYFFVDYTDLKGDTIISRFSIIKTSAASTQSGDPSSEKIILKVHQPYANHNGGQILFGPDGMLWIGTGDGGSEGDPLGTGQSVQTLLGKLLRIDIDHGDPYSIPPDNPFAKGGGLPEIWAYGLRNPWGLKFDPATGDLYIADVGQDTWEEIDYIPEGFNSVPANFGWSLFEGNHPYKNPNGITPKDYVAPVFNYSHAYGCSLGGGIVYRGKDLPAFNGIYLFGDYCSGTIWGLLQNSSGQWVSASLFQTTAKIVSFGADEQGEIYTINYNGQLLKLVKK